MKRLMPLSGIDNVSHDEEMSNLGDNHFIKLKDAINVDINAAGRINLRRTGQLVSNIHYKNLWQSPLHKDVFATLNDQLVKINTHDWSHEVIGKIALGTISYEVVNNYIYIADGINIHIYDGNKFQLLTIETPPQPMFSNFGNGALESGSYIFAISWLRNGIESGLSQSIKVDIESNLSESSIEIILPYCFDASVDSVNVYTTSRNGSELRKYANVSIATNTITINQIDELGRSIQFSHLSPMHSGKFMKFWQGRLLTADKNIIKFSQALNFHLFDERYDYIALPQRITFLQPVDGGIWVGQVDHVIFLMGDEPRQLTQIKKPSQSPIPFSALEMDTESLGEMAQGGRCAVWISEHGYVVGTSSGVLLEPHANQIQGISAKMGRSVRLGQQLITVIT